MPEGDWLEQTRRWWEAATSSVAATVAWADEDRPKLDRLVWLVDHWWRAATSDDPAQVDRAWRNADVIRRAEAELYLGPAERARAGMRKPDEPSGAAPVRSSSRDRLRAVDADAG